MKTAAAALKVAPSEIVHKIDSIQHLVKEQDKEIEKLKIKLSRSSSQELISKAYDVKGTKVLIEMVEAQDPNTLRQNAEMLKDQLGSGIVLLASVSENKVSLVSFVSKDLVNRGLHAQYSWYRSQDSRRRRWRTSGYGSGPAPGTKQAG